MTDGTARASSGPSTHENDRLSDLLATFGPRLSAIANEYRSSLPGRMAAMKDAAMMGGHVMLAGAAHRLAGSSASLGAAEAAALCRALETACACSELVPADWQQRLAEIERACGEFSERLGALDQVLPAATAKRRDIQVG